MSSSKPDSAQKPAQDIQTRPAVTTNNKPRTNASSSEAGMVPTAPAGADREASTTGKPDSPAPKPLSPQARKQQKLQTQLERAIAQAFPDGKNPTQDNLITNLATTPGKQGLTITLANNWYQLTPDAQDRIAAALWNQKGSLKLKGIQLQDAKGNMIARSPVVGDQMVIVRR